MIPQQAFKVASVSTNPNSFGLHGHVMIAEDGETWQVGRSRSGGIPKPWEQGEIVQAPLMDDPIQHITRPAWDELQCEIPERMPDALTKVVDEVWGRSAAVDGLELAARRELEPSTVFTAEQFKPTQCNSAQDKADFGNAFVRFVENIFQQAHFLEWF